MGLLMWQNLDGKKPTNHLILKNKQGHKAFKGGGCPTACKHQVLAHEEAVVIA